MTAADLSSLPITLREAINGLMASPHVQGILLVGSRSRGFQEEGSSDHDLELVVDDAFAKELEPLARLSLLWDGVPFQSRLLGDIFTYSRSEIEAKATSLLDVDHWPYEAAQLWYDRDGEIAPLIARLAHFPEGEWETRLKLHYVDFWTHTARAITIAARESTLNRALVLGRAAQGYMRCVFVLNRRWPPLPHWAEQALEQSALTLRPANDIALLNEALTTLNPEPLKELHDALDPLLDDLGFGWHRERLPLLVELFGPESEAVRQRWLR
ncbi:MAG: DUF4037 domain-containing protein [Ardenticatenales bacterium]|nr:DUF4037 domain-containing protein [Ardenticatenales bacterium]